MDALWIVVGVFVTFWLFIVVAGIGAEEEWRRTSHVTPPPPPKPPSVQEDQYKTVQTRPHPSGKRPTQRPHTQKE